MGRLLVTRMPSKWNRRCRTDRHKVLQQINDSKSSELEDWSISSLNLGIYRQVKNFLAATEAFCSWLVEVCIPLLCSRLQAQEKGEMCNLHLYSKDKKSRSPESLKYYCHAANAKSMVAKHPPELPVVQEPGWGRDPTVGKRSNFYVRTSVRTAQNPLILWSIVGIFKKGEMSIKLKYKSFRKLCTRSLLGW